MDLVFGSAQGSGKVFLKQPQRLLTERPSPAASLRRPSALETLTKEGLSQHHSQSSDDKQACSVYLKYAQSP